MEGLREDQKIALNDALRFNGSYGPQDRHDIIGIVNNVLIETWSPEELAEVNGTLEP